VYLVGFAIEICYDAWPYERQIFRLLATQCIAIKYYKTATVLPKWLECGGRATSRVDKRKIVEFWKF